MRVSQWKKTKLASRFQKTILSACFKDKSSEDQPVLGSVPLFLTASRRGADVDIWQLTQGRRTTNITYDSEYMYRDTRVSGEKTAVFAVFLRVAVVTALWKLHRPPSKSNITLWAVELLEKEAAVEAKQAENDVKKGSNNAVTEEGQSKENKSSVQAEKVADTSLKERGTGNTKPAAAAKSTTSAAASMKKQDGSGISLALCSAEGVTALLSLSTDVQVSDYDCVYLCKKGMANDDYITYAYNADKTRSGKVLVEHAKINWEKGPHVLRYMSAESVKIAESQPFELGEENKPPPAAEAKVDAKQSTAVQKQSSISLGKSSTADKVFARIVLSGPAKSSVSDSDYIALCKPGSELSEYETYAYNAEKTTSGEIEIDFTSEGNEKWILRYISESGALVCESSSFPMPPLKITSSSAAPTTAAVSTAVATSNASPSKTGLSAGERAALRKIELQKRREERAAQMERKREERKAELERRNAEREARMAESQKQHDARMKKMKAEIAKGNEEHARHIEDHKRRMQALGQERAKKNREIIAAMSAGSRAKIENSSPSTAAAVNNRAAGGMPASAPVEAVADIQSKATQVAAAEEEASIGSGATDADIQVRWDKSSFLIKIKVQLQGDPNNKEELVIYKLLEDKKTMKFKRVAYRNKERQIQFSLDIDDLDAGVHYIARYEPLGKESKTFGIAPSAKYQEKLEARKKARMDELQAKRDKRKKKKYVVLENFTGIEHGVLDCDNCWRKGIRKQLGKTGGQKCKCKTVMFCSRECFNEAWRTWHVLECSTDEAQKARETRKACKGKYCFWCDWRDRKKHAEDWNRKHEREFKWLGPNEDTGKREPYGPPVPIVPGYNRRMDMMETRVKNPAIVHCACKQIFYCSAYCQNQHGGYYSHWRECPAAESQKLWREYQQARKQRRAAASRGGGGGGSGGKKKPLRGDAVFKLNCIKDNIKKYSEKLARAEAAGSGERNSLRSQVEKYEAELEAFYCEYEAS
eukprot:jgi/Bigna1/68829/fgenesh1_pg.7_\